MNSLLKFDLADLSETNTQLEIVVNTLEEMYQELNHVQETLAKSSNSLYIEKITNELIPTISTDIDYLSQTLEMNFEHLLTVNYGVNDIFGPREPIEVDYEALSKWTKELELLICDIKKMNKSLILSHVEQEYKNMRSKLETEIQQDKHKVRLCKAKAGFGFIIRLRI